MSDTVSTGTKSGRIAALVGDVQTRFRQYRTYQNTLGELQTLTDRELADMGLHRSTLRSIAYQAAYGG